MKEVIAFIVTLLLKGSIQNYDNSQTGCSGVAVARWFVEPEDRVRLPAAALTERFGTSKIHRHCG